MKRSSRRPEQVAGTIRQVIADALAREVRDPRVGFVTITAVLVSGPSHALVAPAPRTTPTCSLRLNGLVRGIDRRFDLESWGAAVATASPR